MINKPFPEIHLSEDIKDAEKKRKNASDSGVSHDFTTIVLDPDDNIFKTVTGKFSNKKDCYQKLSKRGFVVRKSFETKIYDWILRNAKTTFDAYLMLSTAFSKWKGNNVLDDYYIKMLNDIPDLNRERQKGNPNTKGNADLPNKPSPIDEDIDIPQNIAGGYQYGMSKADQRKLYRNPDSVEFNDAVEIRALSPEELMAITDTNSVNRAIEAFELKKTARDNARIALKQKSPVDTINRVHLEPMVKGSEALESPEIWLKLRERLNNSDENNETLWMITSPTRDIEPVVLTPTAVYSAYKYKIDNPQYIWGRHQSLNRRTSGEEDTRRLNRVSNNEYNFLSKEADYWNHLKTNPEKIRYMNTDATFDKNFFNTGAHKNTPEYIRFKNDLLAAKDKLETVFNNEKLTGDIYNPSQYAQNGMKLSLLYPEDKFTWKDFDPDNKEDLLLMDDLRKKMLDRIREKRKAIQIKGDALGVINRKEKLSPKVRYKDLGDKNIAPGNPKHQGTDNGFVSYLDQRQHLLDLVKKQPSPEFFKALKKLRDEKRVQKKSDSPVVAGNRQQSKKAINDIVNSYNHKDESISKSKTRQIIETAVNRGASLLYGTEHNPFNSLPAGQAFVGTVVTEKTNDSLNDDLFLNGKLKDEVKAALLKVAKVFEETLEMPIKPVDVYFTGSNANYNYNDQSDIDIHLVYDFTQLQDQALENFNDLIEDYLKAKKHAFNHEYDIKIKGKPVEVGTEDLNSPIVSTGVYSLSQNNWIREPKKIDVDDTVNNPVYKKIVDLIEKTLNSNDAIKIKSLWNNLKDMRKNSLATEGEFGKGNLVFKKLRNDGYLAKIKETYNLAKSKDLSLESLEEME